MKPFGCVKVNQLFAEHVLGKVCLLVLKLLRQRKPFERILFHIGMLLGLLNGTQVQRFQCFKGILGLHMLTSLDNLSSIGPQISFGEATGKIIDGKDSKGLVGCCTNLIGQVLLDLEAFGDSNLGNLLNFSLVIDDLAIGKLNCGPHDTPPGSTSRIARAAQVNGSHLFLSCLAVS